MKKTIIKGLALCALVAGSSQAVEAQAIVSDTQKQAVEQAVAACLPQNMGIGNLKTRNVALAGDTIVVDVTENFGDVPFTRASIESLKGDIRTAMGAGYSNAPVALSIAGNPIENYYADFEPSYGRKHAPFITPAESSRHYSNGLDGNVVALWPSHGWYFEPYLNRWEWQRARMFQTVEDMYTHSYVNTFLIPMLENAGAYVWSARERDPHNFGVVVDNDGGKAQSSYSERNGKKKWKTGKDAGFAYNRAAYRDFENPFTEGTYRQVDAVDKANNASTASWDADMPQAGEYALYISYKTLPNSARDVVYTVNARDGEHRFTVDQTMAGGVWVYLGTFQLDKGVNANVVTVSNVSKQRNAVVTADAIRIGGGKGNIERRVALPTEENKRLAEEQKDTKYLGREDMQYDYIGSGDHPWFHIGARYYLQWAGFPHQVYSTSNGINDYTDDYRSRGEWVNYLAGGSEALPDSAGLNVPVDVSFCLHTDAGTTQNDDIIGTLLIYCTRSKGKQFGTYANGTPRELSRQFADLISTEVVNDIRARYEPNWTRRGMWDKSYYEARVPEVPAVLMELLSHQNFADMKYGLDPMFRFDVSRSIYKGILKFIAKRDHREYVVQPLPVNSMALERQSRGKYMLSWKPTHDELSSNADPTSYIVCERVGNGPFKEVATVRNPYYLASVNDNQIHSYRVIAVNDGGRSFNSETLSLGEAANSRGDVVVVNGFTRVSAPDWFDGSDRAGFDDARDHGVPYIEQINYLGAQYEFRRNLPWRDDDAPGFGACRSNYETQNIAGNTFDYTTIHGAALLKAGYSFVSCSMKALENGASYTGYKAMDIILGKQKEVKIGRGAVPSRFKIYTPAMREAVTRFAQQGGNVIVSGSYVGTDIWDRENASDEEKRFAGDILGFEWLNGQAALDGKVYTVNTPASQLPTGKKFSFCHELNSERYAVESPDAIKASDKAGFTWMRYSENNLPAGIASDRGTHRVVVLGFPIETVDDADARTEIVEQAMNYFNKQ